jgi:hypothetical protein
MARLYRGALGSWGFTLLGFLALAACGGGTRTADGGSATADSSSDRSTAADVGVDSRGASDGGPDGRDLDSSSPSDASAPSSRDGATQFDPKDAGSVDGPSCDRSVGADGASSDALPPPHDATSDATASCDWGGINNEGNVGIGAIDANGASLGCKDTPCAFSFTVNDHRVTVFAHTSDIWDVTLLGNGTLQTQQLSGLGFLMPWGWDVSWAPGQTLQGLSLLRMLGCPDATVDRGEFPVQAHLSLRDDAGRLLVLSGYDVPLTPNGEALLDPAFAPELNVSWKDLCCPAYHGPGVGPEGGGRRTVGLVVRDAATGDQAMATWGHNATVKIQGRTYILAVSQGWVYADALGCGRTQFAIYSEGYLSRVR